MCGICGLVSRRRNPRDIQDQIQAMLKVLRHRGPDGEGVWLSDDQIGLGLGHRRLSIVDLSSHGAQPMSSQDGRWVVTFNGEIYNHRDLREDLEKRGVTFEGHSDTEVLVACLEAYGVEDTLPRLVGMFGFAAWNQATRRLWLARDRLGQKPLFYGTFQDEFVFGSELSVMNTFAEKPELDRDALAMMLRYKAIPAPWTVYRGLFKLMPATHVEFDHESFAVSEPRTYWTPALDGGNQGSDPGDFQDRASALLDEAVRLRLMGDVPIGAFLSGGIDSTLVVDAMQRNSSRAVKTFTIGYESAAFNEAEQAAVIAERLGTDHTRLLLTEQDTLDLVPQIGELYDEPFGDSSQIPTLLLSRLTRQHVTVALSGDGGDEAFGGYNRHVWLPRISQYLRPLPSPARRFLLAVLNSSGVRATLRTAADRGWLPIRLVDDKMDKLSAMLSSTSLEHLFRDALSDWDDPCSLVRGSSFGSMNELAGVPQTLSEITQLCLADSRHYLPNDILVKVDRASMAFSLEARSPFLDHRLFEFGLGLPDSAKVRGTKGKQLLVHLLGRRLPKELWERPKMGFAVPIGDWLRADLRDWAEALFQTMDPDLLNVDRVQKTWAEHLRGERNHQHKLWNVLMLLSWLGANNR